MITCNITLESEAFIQIECGKDGMPTMRSSGTLNANESAAVHAVMETMRCLSTGKNIDHHFNPTINTEDDHTLMQCMWERSGRLKIVGPAKKRFMHADTPDAAMSRRRVFTCTKFVLRSLPTRRFTITPKKK